MTYQDARVIAAVFLGVADRILASSGLANDHEFYVPLASPDQYPGEPAGYFVDRRTGEVEFVSTCFPEEHERRLRGMVSA